MRENLLESRHAILQTTVFTLLSVTSFHEIHERIRRLPVPPSLAILPPICHIVPHDDTEKNHLPFPLTTLPGGGRLAMCIRESDNSKEIKMSSITLEIRAAEGGDDAKLFVGELANAYERLCLSEG